MTKNVTNTSMVAIRVWAKCIKSAANNMVAKVAIHVSLKSFFENKYKSGNIAIPNKVPIIRHPNGHIPKRRIPIEIINLPSGGCVHS